MTEPHQIGLTRGGRPSDAELDRILSLQLAVAWAGESGEEPRLGWWRSDLTSEFGGEDLFQRLLPRTWRWATLQASREAARRRDAEARQKDHEPDSLLSLFRLGFEVDERLDERFREMKALGKRPVEVLSSLGAAVGDGWDRERFVEWVGTHGKVDVVTTPSGRRLKGEPPESFDLLVQKLVAGLAPLGDEYPLPHFRRGR